MKTEEFEKQSDGCHYSDYATGWIESCSSSRIFSPKVDTGFGAYPAPYQVGVRVSSLGVLAPGAWIRPVISSSAETKNAWSYTSAPCASSWRRD